MLGSGSYSETLEAERTADAAMAIAIFSQRRRDDNKNRNFAF